MGAEAGPQVEVRVSIFGATVQDTFSETGHFWRVEKVRFAFLLSNLKLARYKHFAVIRERKQSANRKTGCRVG